MAWILIQVVISCYPNRAMICSNVWMEVAFNGCHNFRRESSEVLVDTSKSCIVILNTYLRGAASNSKYTGTIETDSMEYRKDWKIKSCLSAQEISFLLCKLKIHYLVYKNMKLVHLPSFWNTTHIKTHRSRILSPLVKMKIPYVDHTIYLCASWRETIISVTPQTGSFCALCR
jgi:hypothetical protein